jgi:hypothetical protein
MTVGPGGVFGVAFDACAPSRLALVIANVVATHMASRDRSIMDLTVLVSRFDGSIRRNTRDPEQGGSRPETSCAHQQQHAAR